MQLEAHDRQLQWFVNQLVDCVAGRSSRQQVADVLWAKLVCDQGGTILDVGSCGEMQMAVAAKRKEHNQATKKRKRLKEEEKRKKVDLKRTNPRREPVSDRGGRGRSGALPKKAIRIEPPATTLLNRGAASFRGGLGRGHSGSNLCGDASVDLRGQFWDRSGSGAGGPLPTYSAECSLCCTSFPAASQEAADAALHQHLMDTLFGARVGPHRRPLPAAPLLASGGAHVTQGAMPSMWRSL